MDGLFAGHNPENTVSRHLLQKLGFRYTHDEFYAPTGLQHPSYMMESKDYWHMREKLHPEKTKEKATNE